jgi:hypothetical protein
VTLNIVYSVLNKILALELVCLPIMILCSKLPEKTKTKPGIFRCPPPSRSFPGSSPIKRAGSLALSCLPRLARKKRKHKPFVFAPSSTYPRGAETERERKRERPSKLRNPRRCFSDLDVSSLGRRFRHLSSHRNGRVPFGVACVLVRV